MAAERANRTPYLIGSVLVHAAVVGSLFIAWPHNRKPVKVVATPVTLVAEGPTNIRPAVQAPEEAPAQTENPVPDATPEPVAPPAPQPEPAPPPKPQPKPVPPPPTPKPTTAPKPAPAKPSPQKPAPPAKDAFDLDALAASIKPGKKPAGRPQSSAQQGASRPETAKDARPAAGPATGLSALQVANIGSELNRLWNPNCEVEGGANVNVRIAIAIDGAGRLVGQPKVLSGASGDSVAAAAADRAVRAVHQAAPFKNLPPGFAGDDFIFNFNARKACAAR